jgi:sugar phosphate permease
MGNANANVDSSKEELGWLKVLFAVLAAVDASLIAWISQNYLRADRVLVSLASVSAISVSALLLWLNYTAYRKIGELKTSS